MKEIKLEKQLFDDLLTKYKLVRPFPPEVKESIISGKKEVLIRVLKTLGAFSFIYALFLAIYFTSKKIIAGLSITKYILSTIAVASISYGAYYTATYLTQQKSKEKKEETIIKEESEIKEKKEPIKRPKTLKAIKEKYKRLDQIILYNDRVIKGAIINRGDVYKIYTIRGIINIPGNKIKMVKPLK